MSCLGFLVLALDEILLFLEVRRVVRDVIDLMHREVLILVVPREEQKDEINQKDGGAEDSEYLELFEYDALFISAAVVGEHTSLNTRPVEEHDDDGTKPVFHSRRNDIYDELLKDSYDVFIEFESSLL